MEMYFPKITVEQFSAINIFADRIKWDPRWDSARIIEEDTGNGAVWYIKSKKPPVPIMGQRDQLLRMWKVEDGLGPGITTTVGYSIEHEDEPEIKGFFAPTQRQKYDIMMSGLEKNPHGTGIKYM